MYSCLFITIFYQWNFCARSAENQLFVLYARNEIVSKAVRREQNLLLLFDAAADNLLIFCHFSGICDTHSNKETNFLPCVCRKLQFSTQSSFSTKYNGGIFSARPKLEERRKMILCLCSAGCCRMHTRGGCSVITKRRRLAHLRRA